MSYQPLKIELLEVAGVNPSLRAMRNPMMSHGRSSADADKRLIAKLVQAGDEHAKAVRGVMAYFELKMQIGWMVEWDTYRVGVEVLSTSSTMHMDYRAMKGHDLADAKQQNLSDVVYTQTAMASYQALRRIYKQRRSHRHPDWQIFCDWIETLPYFDIMIMPESAS